LVLGHGKPVGDVRIVGELARLAGRG
jgi:hypothetical protein